MRNLRAPSLIVLFPGAGTKPAMALAAWFVLATDAWAGETAGQYIDDSALQAALKAKLVGDDLIGGMGINIETRKGVVQLGGWVEDAAKSTEAAQIAASVDGVKKADNQLHAKQGDASIGQKVDDGVITTKVRSAIGNAELETGSSERSTVFP